MSKQKIKEKEEAIRLRKDGKSLKNIAENLNVSKGSVSVWVKNIPKPYRFTKEYREKIKSEKSLKKRKRIEKQKASLIKTYYIT